MATPLVSANFGDALEPGLKKIFVDTVKELPQMVPTLFMMGTDDTSYVKTSSIGAMGDMQDFDATGTVQYDDVSQGYDVKIEFKQFALGFQIARKLYDDDLYSVINKEPRKLAISAIRTREKRGASIFGDAFSGSGSISGILTNSEGKSLCNSAHPSTGSTGYTNQSNTGTTAFSGTAVEATRRLMAAFTDDRGNIQSVNPDMLVIPRALEEKGFTLIASKGIVDSAENNANFHYGKYKLAVWDRLPSSTDWFFCDSQLMKLMLEWYTRIPLEFGQDASFDTFVSKFRAYERYGYGWTDWRWIMGHDVA